MQKKWTTPKLIVLTEGEDKKQSLVLQGCKNVIKDIGPQEVGHLMRGCVWYENPPVVGYICYVNDPS